MKEMFILLPMLFLVACQSISSDYSSESISNQTFPSNHEVKHEEVALSDEVGVFSLEIASLESPDTLLLINLTNQETEATYTLDLGNPAIFGNISEISGGGYAVEIFEEGDYINFDLDSEGNIIGFSQTGIPPMRVFIFDNSLNLQKDITLETDTLIGIHPLSWQEAGNGFNVFFPSFQSFYKYSTNTSETTLLFSIEDGIFINSTHWVSDNLLFFDGHVINDEISTVFGTIDLSLNTYEILAQTDFEANQPVISTPWVLLSENPTGYFLRNEPWRSEVLLINAITGQTVYFQLNPWESARAILSLNGRYVVTVREDLGALRKYDIETGRLVSETDISLLADYGTMLNYHIIAIAENSYQLTAFTNDGESLHSTIIEME
ncbi:MAG: hypothetical protein FWF59_04140 [Turicibacter sp.]|nr:hypothetical protein [Turicibacter sp.]